MFRNKIQEFSSSSPFTFYGLLFILNYLLVNFLLQSLHSYYPEVMRNYLYLIGKVGEKAFYALFLLKIEAYKVYSGTGIWFNDNLDILINESCSGLSLYVLYIALIFTFIPNWLKKIGFAFSGLIFLLILNIVRILLSILVHIYFVDYFTFVHEVLFVYLMYGAILYIWYKIFKIHGVKFQTQDVKAK
jgi:exosortase/archaeosortase family protein